MKKYYLTREIQYFVSSNSVDKTIGETVFDVTMDKEEHVLLNIEYEEKEIFINENWENSLMIVDKEAWSGSPDHYNREYNTIMYIEITKEQFLFFSNIILEYEKLEMVFQKKLI